MAEKKEAPGAGGQNLDGLNEGSKLLKSFTISKFENATAITPEKETFTVFDALESFRDQTYRSKVVALRRLPEEKYKHDKKKLPCFTFAGTFSKRGKDYLIKSSGLAILDVDHIEDAKRLRENFKKHPFILAAWVSPSGKGVKALARIQAVSNDAEYKTIFEALKKKIPNLDDSGSDVSRLCFVSWDPDLWINEKAKVFQVNVKEQSLKKRKAQKRQDPEKVRYYTDKLITIKPRFDNYNDWLNLGFELASLGEDGREPFHKLSESSDKYDYEAANEKFTKLIKGHNKKKTFASFIDRCLKAGIPKFVPDSEVWVKDHVFLIRSIQRSNKFAHVLVDENNVAEYFESCGDGRVSEPLLQRITSLADFEKWPKIKNEALNLFDESQIQRDTKTTGYLYFQNCSIKLTKGKRFEVLSGKARPLIWKTHITNENFTPTEKVHDVARIAEKACTDYDQLKLGVGYILHRYWDRAAAKIVWTVDSKPKSRNDGRRGKDLFVTSVQLVRPWDTVKWKPGQSNFWTSNIQPDTSIIHFEDVNNRLAIDEEAKRMITADLHIERKGIDIQTVKFSDKPKFSASSQAYPFGLNDPSIRGRIHLIEFTDYLQKNPLKKTIIYNDRDKSAFFMWIIECFQFYLDNQDRLAGIPVLTEDQQRQALKIEYGNNLIEAVDELDKFFTAEKFCSADELANIIGCDSRDPKTVGRFKELFEKESGGNLKKVMRTIVNKDKTERVWGYERIVERVKAKLKKKKINGFGSKIGALCALSKTAKS